MTILYGNTEIVINGQRLRGFVRSITRRIQYGSPVFTSDYELTVIDEPLDAVKPTVKAAESQVPCEPEKPQQDRQVAFA